MSFFEIIGALLATVALFGYLNHKFIRLPDSIGITATGMVISLVLAVVGHHYPIAIQWASDFSEGLDFSEAVFHGLLGVLLFAGSLHVNISEIAKQRLSIFTLATAGVVISTAVVGVGMYWILEALGLHVALVYCLLFGALISPTDPIAVLGLLKTAGVPKALEMDITGESLSNDGTGVVLFLVLLGIATGTAEASVGSVSKMLAMEVGGAVVVGLALGYVAFVMLKGVDSYPVEILITLALATGGYSLAERLHVSAPLAVVISGLVVGNQGAAHAMSETTRQHLFSFWELLDEVLNLVLFGLIGIKLLSLADTDVSWTAAILTIPLVLLARFISVGIPLLVLKPWLNSVTHTVKILTWGGLRGGISIALALSLPEFGGKDLFVVATYAVVLFSLIVQAPTLSPLLRKWNPQ